DEVDRLNTVVTQFLNYAKPFQQNLTETNLDELLKKTFQTVTADLPSNINLTYHSDAQLPLTTVDPQQINQVFLNLIRNAVQAMPQGGELKVSLKSSKDSLQIVFEDTGLGISPENIKSLFIPFFTTKEEGSGLGLPICQKILKAHGGTIQVESTLQKGTKFIITLSSKKS
ncbi:MAG: GHKL domain-containing protein, partial [Deltaproteobacteria bacterium]|nr:GHKL domain-containing protein [Deltaproteobacteria bacterium]